MRFAKYARPNRRDGLERLHGLAEIAERGVGVLVECHRVWLYAAALYEDDCATLEDLRKSVETLGSVAPLLTRVFGPSHPDTPNVQRALKEAREALARRTAASSSGAK